LRLLIRNYYQILFFTFLSFPLRGAGDLGGKGGAFLRMGFGARPMALANTIVNAGDDAFAGFYNPAYVAGIRKIQLAANYSFLSLDRELHGVSFVFPLPQLASVNFLWLQVRTTDIDGRDFDGNPTGIFSSSENLFQGTFARQFTPRLTLGLSFKIFYSVLSRVSAHGSGFDLGVQYKLNEKMIASYSLKDISSRLSWNTQDYYQYGSVENNSFPLANQLSFGVRLPGWWGMLVGGIQFYDASSNKGVSYELSLQDRVFFRLGYSEKETFHAGLGLRTVIANRQMDLNYAFFLSPWGDVPGHIFSWQISL
jgi:hypothetical protein